MHCNHGVGSCLEPLLLISALLCIIPPTTVLGAILSTAHLGGAVAANVRAASLLSTPASPSALESSCGRPRPAPPRLRTLIPLWRSEV